MLRIAICDDDKILVTQIEEMLNRYLDKKMIDRYIEIFYDGASLERIYEKGDRFDIIYLDIEMSGKNGIEAAKSIRRLDRDVLLIYVSSYETYFMQLFEVEPFRFIKKPIKETEFEEVIDFAYERIIEEDAYFEYKYNKTVGKVLIRKIMYFESAGRIVNIHTEESTYRYYGKLDEVERRLVQNKIPFLRIHKSFYVNFHFVDKITFSKLILSDGTVLQISQDRQNIIRKRYLDILGGTVLLIYVSNYDNYLKELFEVEPFRFMSKPINDKRFYMFLDLAIDRIRSANGIYCFRFNKDILTVILRDVIYFESCGSRVHIVLKGKLYKFYKKLDDVEKEISVNYSIPFIRIHKSYLVNFQQIRKVGYTEVETKDGRILNISDTYKKDVRARYSKLLWDGDV